MSNSQIVHASGSMVLYHIGKRPPESKPYRLDNTPNRGVFLSDQPETVWYYHGIRGHVYAYRVPMWVIRDLGGLTKRIDDVREIAIPAAQWAHVKFLGRSMTQQEMQKKMDTDPAYSNTRQDQSAPATLPQPDTIIRALSRQDQLDLLELSVNSPRGNWRPVMRNPVGKFLLEFSRGADRVVFTDLGLKVVEKLTRIHQFDNSVNRVMRRLAHVVISQTSRYLAEQR